MSVHEVLDPDDCEPNRYNNIHTLIKLPFFFKIKIHQAQKSETNDHEYVFHV